MYNDLFSIGPVTFHMYGLMSAIGIIAAYLLIESRAKKTGYSEEHGSSVLGLIVFCLIFGYLGSKLLYVLTVLPLLRQDPQLFLHSITNGWVIFGGLLGGMFGAWLYCRWKKLPAGRFFDLAFPGVALAQGFGRLGCFFAGCCYGVETGSAFSIVFRHSHYAPNGVHLVPTQLISSALDFLLCLFLLWFDKKRKKHDGELAAMYLFLYSAGRFFLEFWRGDLERGAVGILSTSQFIGLFTLAAGLIMFLYLQTRAETAAETADGETEEEPEAAEEEAETDEGPEETEAPSETAEDDVKETAEASEEEPEAGEETDTGAGETEEPAADRDGEQDG